ncbi:hypothetical protein ACFYPT_42040 [Streptomyces sp. NPDC005529]|uniref:hypothetical protein n=1 Tax=unclassified Streptomyces TaxID=2593676 RepID=UPI0033B71B3C
MMLSSSLALFAAGSSSAATVGGSNGSTVVYSDGTYLYRVHVNTDGSHDTPAQIMDQNNNPIHGVDPSLSPGGDSVAYRTGVTGGVNGVPASAGSRGYLDVVSINGGTASQVDTDVMSAGTWNPTKSDGAAEELAYVKKNPSDNGAMIFRERIHGSAPYAVPAYVMRIGTAVEGAIDTGDDNPSTHTLTSPPASTYHPHNSQVAWSPDGTKLALTGYDGGLATLNCTNDVATGGNANNNNTFGVGRDCRTDSYLYTVNAYAVNDDSNGLVRIHEGLGDSSPTWSPQGYVLFSSYGRENSQIVPVTPQSPYWPSEWAPDTGWGQSSGGLDGGLGDNRCNASALSTAPYYVVAQSQWGWNSEAAGTQNGLDMHCPGGSTYLTGGATQNAAAHLWSVLPTGGGMYGNASSSPLPGQGQVNLGASNVVSGSYGQLFQQWDFTNSWFHNYENSVVTPDGLTTLFTVDGTLNLATLSSSGGIGTPVSTGLNAAGGVSVSATLPFDSVIRNANGAWQAWQGSPLSGLPGNAAPTKIAVAGTGNGNAEVVARGQDGMFYMADRTSSAGLGTWSAVPGTNGAPHFGGPSVSAAASNDGSDVAVAAVGLDGGVWVNVHIVNPSYWGIWGKLTAPFTATKVAVALDSHNNTYIIATDGHSVYLNMGTSIGGNWSGWQSMASLPGGVGASGDIAIAGNGNGIGAQLAVIDNNHQVWHNLLNTTNDNGNPTGWAKPAQISGGVSSIAAAGIGNGDAQFLAVGQSDGKLYHNDRYVNGSWSGWGVPSGMNGAASFKASQVGIANLGSNDAFIMATAG